MTFLRYPVIRIKIQICLIILFFNSKVNLRSSFSVIHVNSRCLYIGLCSVYQKIP